jgi:hypothetical protein
MADVADREPSWRHNAYVDYLTEQTGVDVDPKSVQLATALYKDFVGSEHYAAAAQAQDDAKQARLDDKASAARQRVLDRAAKLQAKAAEVLAAAGIEAGDEVGAKRATKAAAPKAAKVVAPKAPPKPPAPPVRPAAPTPSDDGDGF